MGHSTVDERPLVLEAPAKINLTLEVLGRRPDGFHDICSVFQRITLADRLEIAPAPDLRLACNRPALAGPDNLVWRAAQLLQQHTGYAEHAEHIGTDRQAGVSGHPSDSWPTRSSRGALLTLHKRIPIAAGLGGGSSDAAAALRGLRAFWQLPLDDAKLHELATELGSDVPFFLLESPCAVAEGRGERLTPLAPLPDRWLVLLKPAVGISAGTVYRAFPKERWREGQRTHEWLELARRTGTVPPPFNDLEAIALHVAPEASAARQALLDAGAAAPFMSGSGSTYVALCQSPTEAETIAARLTLAGWDDVHVAQFANAAPPLPL